MCRLRELADLQAADGTFTLVKCSECTPAWMHRGCIFSLKNVRVVQNSEDSLTDHHHGNRGHQQGSDF